MSNLYSVRVTKGSQVQYYRTEFYMEALNLVAKLFDKLGDNIKVLVKKLTYNSCGDLVMEEIRMDIEWYPFFYMV